MTTCPQAEVAQYCEYDQFHITKLGLCFIKSVMNRFRKSWYRDRHPLQSCAQQPASSDALHPPRCLSLSGLLSVKGSARWQAFCSATSLTGEQWSLNQGFCGSSPPLLLQNTTHTFPAAPPSIFTASCTLWHVHACLRLLCCPASLSLSFGWAR